MGTPGDSQLDIWEDHQRVEAVVADTELTTLLKVQVGAPLLLIVRHFLMGRETAALFRSHFRADRYYYTVKLAQEAQAKRQAVKREVPLARPHRKVNSSGLPIAGRLNVDR